MSSPRRRSPQRFAVLSPPTDQSATPLTFSIQLPFILLGTDTAVNPNSTTSGKKTPPPDQLSRLLTELEAGAQGVRFVLWEPTQVSQLSSNPQTLLHDPSSADFKRKFQEAESKRWTRFSQQNKWILRHPPSGDADIASAHGLLGPWVNGDALLSGDEERAAGHHIWAFPFLLQRFGVPAHDEDRFEREVRSLYRALRSAREGMDRRGGRHAIVVGEQCWPCVEFAPPMDGVPVGGNVLSPTHNALSPHKGFGQSFGGSGEHGASGWSEDQVANLLALWMVFEKAILSVGTVDVLHTYFPLSHVFTLGAVEQLRRAKADLLDSVRGGMQLSSGRKGREPREAREAARTRARAEWERIRADWVQRLKWQDEDDAETEEALAQEGRDWWADIEQVGPREAVERIQRLEAKGQRAGISFSSSSSSQPHSSHSQPESTSDSSSVEQTRGADSDGGTTTRSPPPFPHITAMVFPLPLRTLSPSPLLAYLTFLTHIVLFATERSRKAMTQRCAMLSDTGARSLEQELRKATLVVGLKKESAGELIRLLLEGREEGDGVDADDTDNDREAITIENKIEKGESITSTNLKSEEEGEEVTPEAQKKKRPQEMEHKLDLERKRFAIETAARDMELLAKGIIDKRDKWRGEMQDWLDVYEKAGGFKVPRRMEILGLLEKRSNSKWRG